MNSIAQCEGSAFGQDCSTDNPRAADCNSERDASIDNIEIDTSQDPVVFTIDVTNENDQVAEDFYVGLSGAPGKSREETIPGGGSDTFTVNLDTDTVACTSGEDRVRVIIYIDGFPQYDGDSSTYVNLDDEGVC